MGKATDLQQAPYPRVIHGRYCMQAMKAELKPRHSHKIPVGIEELKGFVGIVSGPPPPVCDGVVIEIGYAEKANCVYGGAVSTRAVLKKCWVLSSLNSRASPILTLTGAVALSFAVVG